MLGALLAVVVIAAGLLGTYWWFGIFRRRAAETEAGIRSLANMKWRECVGLVMEWLHSEGYQEELSSRQPGDGGTEFLLRHDGEQVLLSYKHGTAYRIGEANVRDFANGVQMAGAKSGILVTLGAAESAAHELGRRHNVKLVDGPALWPRVERYVSPTMRAAVRTEASGGTSKGLWIGGSVSVLLGVLAFLVAQQFAPPEPKEVAVAPKPAVVAPVAAAQEDRTLRQINETARAMAEVAALTDEQRLQRRADAAAKVGAITKINTAGWAAESTLVLSLTETDGKDAILVDEVCRTLTQYEELRYTRIQLEPPVSSNVAVRWRQCQ